MNQEQAGEILRANVKTLSESLKSAVEFALTNFFTPSAAELAKKFLASLSSMTTEDTELKAQIDAAYYTLMNTPEVRLDLEDLPHEIWRDIVGYEGLYQVSNLGRVKSFKRDRLRILRAHIDRHGEYFMIALYKDNKSKLCRLHILVAETFVPNIDKKPFVNHMDGNKLNNRASNLEWVTQSENQIHAYKLGLMKARKGIESPCAVMTEDEVRYIRKIYKPYDREFGAKALAKKFNRGITTIRHIINKDTYKNVT